MEYNKNEQKAKESGFYFDENNVLRNKKGNQPKTYLNKDGYKQHSFRYKGKPINFFIHRMVAYEKFGELLYGEGMVVRHLNNNKKDNSFDNISIGTHKENMGDKNKNETLFWAIYASSFLKKHNHQEIKDFYAKERSYKKTMEKFSIPSKGTLHFILNGRTKK